MCFDFLYNFFSETFLILKSIQRDITVNVYWSCKVPLFLSEFNVTCIFSRNFRKVLKFCERAYRTFKMQRILVHQQNLESAVKNVSVSRRSPPLPTTSLNYIKQLNTILITVDYIELERVDPDSRRTGGAAIAAHPVATRKGLSSDKRYVIYRLW